MEIKLSLCQLEMFQIRCKMDGCFGVPRVGLGGGLALLWKSSIPLSIMFFSNGHIDSIVIHPTKGSFRLIGFYGNLDPASRLFSWQLLERLSLLSSMSWFILGDFNEILTHSDKKGGRTRPGYQIDHLRSTIDNCSLRSVPFVGYKFTWSNRCVGDAHVKEYIDRCFATVPGQLLFPQATMQQINSSASDHNAICLFLEGFTNHGLCSGKRFHFESV